MLHQSNSPVLSIVLPCFNSELFLKDAINSVLNQTLCNWELIIVDDASTDSTLQIATEYQKNYKNITVLKSKINIGPSGARNLGLTGAKGEYIGFLDSDDLLYPDFVEKMLSILKTSSADIIWCGSTQIKFIPKNNNSYIERLKKNYIKNSFPEFKNLTPDEVFRKFFIKNEEFNSVGNKIYSKKLIIENNITFNESRIRAEDLEFNIIAFKKSNNIFYTEGPLYLYRIRNNSVMSRFRIEDYENIWNTIELFNNLNKDFNLGLSEKNILNIHKLALIEYVYRGLSNNFTKEIYLILKYDERYNNYLKRTDISELPYTYRVLFALCKLKLYKFAGLYVKIRNFINKF